MAFPVVGTLINGVQLNDDNKQRLRQRDQLQKMRQFLLDLLFPQQTILDQNSTPQQLAQIAQILGRTAGNEPTVYDNGSSRSSTNGNANALTQQVERALTKVLGRAPGRGNDGFITALNSAFPTDAYGRVMMTPTRSIVSLTGNGNYSNVGDGFYSPASLGNYSDAGSYSPAPSNGSGVGQLPVEQANLYRQASINAADALRVLEALQPFEPTADVDAVEALRALIRLQINSLVDEFGRIDKPRPDRVETYLNTLDSAVVRLGEQAQVNINSAVKVFPVTQSDETQVAGFELLRNYANTLRTIWEKFTETNNIERTITGQYSARLSRSYIMLPVISDSNTSFMAAMDSVGFTASERRSDAALFSILGTPRQLPDDTRNATVVNLPFFSTSDPDTSFDLLLPDITVNDYNEWVERFATIEAPSILSASGQFGLDFVTDQADTLFWVIGTVLSEIKRVAPGKSSLLLDKVLSFERVQQTLSEFLFQLDTLADLGVGSTAEPTVNILSKVSGDKQPGEEGQSLQNPLVVQVTNGGSPLPGVSLTFTPSVGSVSLTSSTSTTTNDQGQASVKWTLGPADVPNRVEVSGSGIPAVTFTAGNIISVEEDNQSGPANRPLLKPLVVKVMNGGSPVPGVMLKFEVESGGGTVQPSSLVTDTNGRVQVIWTLGNTGDQKVKVSGTDIPTVTVKATIRST